MFPELKLVITDNKIIIDTISKETHDTHPAFMARALNEFRLQVNAAITKLIENSDDTCDIMEEDEGDSDNDEEDIEVSPKKRKK